MLAPCIVCVGAARAAWAAPCWPAAARGNDQYTGAWRDGMKDGDGTLRSGTDQFFGGLAGRGVARADADAEERQRQTEQYFEESFGMIVLSCNLEGIVVRQIFSVAPEST